jgi:hypothetical protein
MTDDPRRLLLLSEVAELLVVSKLTVERLTDTGQLRSVPSKAGVGVTLADLGEFLAQRLAGDPGQPDQADGAQRRRRGPYKPAGVARTLKSRPEKKGRRTDGRPTGRWIAVYVDLGGKVRQAGIRKSKTLADKLSTDTVSALNRSAGNPVAPETEAARSMLDYIDRWPDADDKHPRTAQTDRERALRVCRYFPVAGDEACAEHERALEARRRASGTAPDREPLPSISERAAAKLGPADLSRAQLLLTLSKMRDAKLNRKTIADAFTAMSRLLRALAVNDPSIVDHAHGIKIVGKPRRYKPRPKRKHRARPAAEVHHFIENYVDRDEQPIFWTPGVTGVRLQDLLAINYLQRNAAEQTIRLHEVVDRNGHLEPGLKTTHDIEDEEERSTTTLFPTPLAQMYERRAIPLDGYLVRTSTGKLFSHRNFYRDLWGDKPGTGRVGPMTRYELDGGQRFTPQDLRKCFSSWLGDAGVPQWIVDSWLGHRDPTLETILGNQRRGSVLMRHYMEEMGTWRPVALEILSTVMLEGRLPALRIVRG